MSKRFITRSGFAVAAAASLIAMSPAAAQRTPPGQLVQEVAKLNQAQLAFVKKLAQDESFARELDAAMASGNSDAAATLVAGASGVSKGSIQVTTGGGRDDSEAASNQEGVMRLAVVRNVRRITPSLTSGTICFDFRVVKGCINW